MKIEINFNKLCGDWWFDIGLSFQKMHVEHKYVFTIALMFFSIYFRFGKK